MHKPVGEMNSTNELSLKIVPKGQKPLTKEQQMFNKLTKRIATLKEEILNEDLKLSKLLNKYSEKVAPLQPEKAKMQFELAMTLGKVAGSYKLSKNQTNLLREAILCLCEDSFEFLVPNPEQEAFFDSWNEISYKEQLEQQSLDAKEMFSDMMSNMFGLDLDMEDIDDTPEGYARLHEKLKSQYEANQERQSGQGKKKSKHKSKEEALKLEEDTKNKSIRSIYITLAKILHPDVETDPTLKLEKEEVMKKITTAYEQKDLVTLLMLEMEWVHKTAENLESLAGDKLKIYISALKEQVSELERERFMISQHPRYEPIFDMVHLTEKQVLYQISKTTKMFNEIISELKQFKNILENSNSKKILLDFASSVVNPYPF